MWSVNEGKYGKINIKKLLVAPFLEYRLILSFEDVLPGFKLLGCIFGRSILN